MYRLRNTYLVVPICMIVVLLLAGCSLPWQHNASSGLGAKPTAAQVLTTARQKFASVSTFHVKIATQNQGTPSGDAIQLRDAEGDIVMPDKFSAQSDVVISDQVMSIKLITIGKQQYITDPITGQWKAMSGLPDPRAYLNPDTGIISLTTDFQNPTTPVADTVNGTPCWRVNGELDSKYMTPLTGIASPSGTMMPASICVGQADGLPYQFSVTGEVAAGATSQTSLIFVLSKFGENISIAAPQVSMHNDVELT